MKDFIKKNKGNIVFIVFVLVFFFVPGVRERVMRVFLFSPSVEEGSVQGVLRKEEYDIELKGINVPDAHLSDFYGKTLFLNFWGSWCPPCRAEFPSIQELYMKQKENAHFVLIAMQDEEQKLRDFLEKNQYTVPVYMIDSGQLPEILHFNVFPTTFIISKNGEILKKDSGAADWNSSQVHRFLEKNK